MYSFNQAKSKVKCPSEVVAIVRGTIGVEEDGAELFSMSLVLYASVLSRAGGGTPRNSTTMLRASTFQTTAVFKDVTTTVDGELDVAKVENDCNELACLSDTSLGQPDGLE